MGGGGVVLSLGHEVGNGSHGPGGRGGEKLYLRKKRVMGDM